MTTFLQLSFSDKLKEIPVLHHFDKLAYHLLSDCRIYNSLFYNVVDSLKSSRLIITRLPFMFGVHGFDSSGLSSFWAASVIADSLCWRWRFPIFMFRCFSVSNWVYSLRNSSWKQKENAEVTLHDLLCTHDFWPRTLQNKTKRQQRQQQ